MFSNFKAANTLFKTVWTIYYQSCTENTSQHPPGQRHCSLHRCGFSLFIGKSSSFLSFYIFWQIRISDWAVPSPIQYNTTEQLELGASFPPHLLLLLHLTIIGASGSIRREGGVNMNTSFKRLRKEMQVKEVDEMIALGANKENIRDWRAVIKGLSSTHFNTTE